MKKTNKICQLHVMCNFVPESEKKMCKGHQANNCIKMKKTVCYLKVLYKCYVLEFDKCTVAT